jgi:hypothetical protein
MYFLVAFLHWTQLGVDRLGIPSSAKHERNPSRHYLRCRHFTDWLRSYIKVTLPVLEILNMTRYFPDRPRVYVCMYIYIYIKSFLNIEHIPYGLGNAILMYANLQINSDSELIK